MELDQQDEHAQEIEAGEDEEVNSNSMTLLIARLVFLSRH
jgi:hypothetical protein